MHPGVHYKVKDGGEDWLAYPDSPATAQIRNTWIIKRRRRPTAPTFMGAPVLTRAKQANERSCLLTMAYFHPWTLRAKDAEDKIVPYAGALRTHQETWPQALQKWLDGHIISQTSLRYVSIF